MKLHGSRLGLTLGALFLGLVITGSSAPLAHGWVYGMNTIVTQVSSYNNAIMTTDGLEYSSEPTAGISWYIDSYTPSNDWFMQMGPLWTYGGVCEPDGPNASGSVCIPSQSWGYFWTWSTSGDYYGNGVLLSTLHASITDSVTYSMNLFPSVDDGCMAFDFIDVTSGYGVTVWTWNTGASSALSASHGPDVLVESGSTSGFGGANLVDVSFLGQTTAAAYNDVGYGAVNGGPPSSGGPETNVLLSNFAEYLGFGNGGTTYTESQTMWTQTTSTATATQPSSSGC